MSAKLYDKEGKCLVENLEIADTFFSRLKGLLGKKSISRNYGLLLVPCGSIHMFFMKFPIDVFFLKKASGGFEILKIVKNLAPWRMCFAPTGTGAVLEVSPGTVTGVKKSETFIRLRENENRPPTPLQKGEQSPFHPPLQKGERGGFGA